MTLSKAGEFPAGAPSAETTTETIPIKQTAVMTAEAGFAHTAEVPLCVDLDGTLVKSDTLLDSVLVLARQDPRALLKLPGWLGQGKARFKQQVTAAVRLDVQHLPYNRPLLEWLRTQAGAGRAIYLATAADRGLAERVAEHLGFFRGVLASDGETNLAGGNKLAAFRGRFGEDFCYIGNASPDIPLLGACRTPMVANPTRGLRGVLRANPAMPVFADRSPALKSWLKAVRLHQWAKNVLLFIPLLLGHAWFGANILCALLAFLSFGMCASATYILNDLLDIEADRRHPRKSRRPFAAGDLSPLTGIAVVAALLAGAFALALSLPHLFHFFPRLSLNALLQPYGFLKWLLIYTGTTLLYSLYLKRKLLVDVFLLSGLYTVRILAGSAATGVPVSAWLAGFSVFFFLSLAFVKRFSELEGLRERGGGVSHGRGYVVSDLEQLRALGTGAAYAAVVVVTLYINSPEVRPLYEHHRRLWLVVPIVLLWLSQVWLLASRGEMHDDPVVWAITDKRSLLLGVLMAIVVWFAL